MLFGTQMMQKAFEKRLPNSGKKSSSSKSPKKDQKSRPTETDLILGKVFNILEKLLDAPQQQQLLKKQKRRHQHRHHHHHHHQEQPQPSKPQLSMFHKLEMIEYRVKNLPKFDFDAPLDVIFEEDEE